MDEVLGELVPAPCKVSVRLERSWGFNIPMCEYFVPVVPFLGQQPLNYRRALDILVYFQIVLLRLEFGCLRVTSKCDVVHVQDPSS